jgi:hypothetical protein
MCDYSLEMYHSRPAVTGEPYTLHLFRSGSMGFVAPTDCATAICMPAGARLRLEGIEARVQKVFGVGPTEQAEMVRLSLRGRLHRDAVRFANGQEVLLQQLNTGIVATVLPRDLAALLDLEMPENSTRAQAHRVLARAEYQLNAESMPQPIAVNLAGGFRQALTLMLMKLRQAVHRLSSAPATASQLE